MEVFVLKECKVLYLEHNKKGSMSNCLRSADSVSAIYRCGTNE